jgi:Mor family transcriptional regulator
MVRPNPPVEQLRRLDDEIAALHTKLLAKVNARKRVLTGMIDDGNKLAAQALETVSVARAANYISNGRSFSDDQIRAIRSAHQGGESQCSIARRYGVSQPSIYKIVTHAAYRDVS